MQAKPERTSTRSMDRADSPWNRAIRVADHADPFSCRTEWQLSYHDVFAPNRRLHLLHGGRSMVAFAERWNNKVGRWIEPIESGWLFGCPLLGDDAAQLLGELLAELDEGECEEFDREGMSLSSVPPPTDVLISGALARHGMRQRLRKALPGIESIEEGRANVLVSASLEGGLDGYLSRRSARVRRNVRNARRRLLADGVVFERHRPLTAADAEETYRRMLAVEHASWKGIGECGMAESPSREFYGLLLRRLAQSGGGRVILARRDQRDIGFIFGGMCGPIYRGQQFSYAEDWAHASLGNVLQYEQIRWLAEEGAERYDMGPQMPYKRHWTEIEQTTTALFVRRT
ncbi:MAG TPA: GNAT family N-acetyltransferase [bacterium]|nr:GNAT family N-acetyltransferase [bacterium]